MDVSDPFGLPLPLAFAPVRDGEILCLRLSSVTGEVGNYEVELSLDDFDGNVFDPPLLVIEPDSKLGDDPHVDTLGDEATQLDPGSDNVVQSYIDVAGDVDPTFVFLQANGC